MTDGLNLNGLPPTTFIMNGYGMVQNEFMHTLVFDLAHGLMVTPFDVAHLCWGRPRLLRRNQLFGCPSKVQTRDLITLSTGIVWIFSKRRFCRLPNTSEYLI